MDNLKAKYHKNPLKADIYNLSELKIILDDLVQEFLTGVKKSKQSKVLTDIRIVVGLISTAISSIVLYLSLTSEFDSHKSILMILVVSYFIINGLAEIYSRYVGSFLIFSDKSISTNINQPDPTYVMMVYNKNKMIPDMYKKSVFDLFDSNGKLIHEEFIDDLDKLFGK